MDNFYEEMDDDIEYTEEDFISEEDIEGEVGDVGESFAMPFSSVYVNQLPDSLNPTKIFKSKELILYNPNDRIQPYSLIEPALLTFDMLKKNLIVNSIRSDQNTSVEQFASYAKILNKGVTPLVASYIEYERAKETLMPEAPKNGFKNAFKPKPQGAAQGRSYNGKK